MIRLHARRQDEEEKQVWLRHPATRLSEARSVHRSNAQAAGSRIMVYRKEQVSTVSLESELESHLPLDEGIARNFDASGTRAVF